MSIKEVKGQDMKKDFQFEQEPGLNVNTQNSANASRNSANSEGEYTDAAFITATGQLLINVNGQDYLIDVEKL